MSKIAFIALIVVLAACLLITGFLYKVEIDKNQLLRAEVLKTSGDALIENKSLKAELASLKASNSKDKQALLDQMTAFSKERDSALSELEAIKKKMLNERELSLLANEDMEKLRKSVTALRQESQQDVSRLEQSFNKKKQLYDTRILSLEAQLAKCNGRYQMESEKYHYNLGVLYSQNKDYETAIKEFKTALGFNPKNSQAHYNLGIIYDDYFKDKENARYHYRTFLELAPASEEAESVREWLDDLDK